MRNELTCFMNDGMRNELTCFHLVSNACINLVQRLERLAWSADTRALTHGMPDVLELLIAHGEAANEAACHVDAPAAGGWTPLMLAASCGHTGLGFRV
jgi:hypothetical protein